jgi:hypothetical protein
VKKQYGIPEDMSIAEIVEASRRMMAMSGGEEAARLAHRSAHDRRLRRWLSKEESVMSGLDGIVAGVADDIVPGLQYSLASKRGAQYVKQRNSVDVLPGDVQHLLGVVAGSG